MWPDAAALSLATAVGANGRDEVLITSSLLDPGRLSTAVLPHSADTAAGRCMASGEPALFDMQSLSQHPEDLQCLTLRYSGTRSFLCVPMQQRQQKSSLSARGEAAQPTACITIGFVGILSPAVLRPIVTLSALVAELAPLVTPAAQEVHARLQSSGAMPSPMPCCSVSAWQAGCDMRSLAADVPCIAHQLLVAALPAQQRRATASESCDASGSETTAECRQVLGEASDWLYNSSWGSFSSDACHSPPRTESWASMLCDGTGAARERGTDLRMGSLLPERALRQAQAAADRPSDGDSSGGIAAGIAAMLPPPPSHMLPTSVFGQSVGMADDVSDACLSVESYLDSTDERTQDIIDAVLAEEGCPAALCGGTPQQPISATEEQPQVQSPAQGVAHSSVESATETLFGLSSSQLQRHANCDATRPSSPDSAGCTASCPASTPASLPSLVSVSRLASGSSGAFGFSIASTADLASWPLAAAITSAPEAKQPTPAACGNTGSASITAQKPICGLSSSHSADVPACFDSVSTAANTADSGCAAVPGLPSANVLVHGSSSAFAFSFQPSAQLGSRPLAPALTAPLLAAEPAAQEAPAPLQSHDEQQMAAPNSQPSSVLAASAKASPAAAAANCETEQAETPQQQVLKKRKVQPQQPLLASPQQQAVRPPRPSWRQRMWLGFDNAALEEQFVAWQGQQTYRIDKLGLTVLLVMWVALSLPPMRLAAVAPFQMPALGLLWLAAFLAAHFRKNWYLRHREPVLQTVLFASLAFGTCNKYIASAIAADKLVTAVGSLQMASAHSWWLRATLTEAMAVFPLLLMVRTSQAAVVQVVSLLMVASKLPETCGTCYGDGPANLVCLWVGSVLLVVVGTLLPLLFMLRTERRSRSTFLWRLHAAAADAVTAKQVALEGSSDSGSDGGGSECSACQPQSEQDHMAFGASAAVAGTCLAIFGLPS